MVFGASSVLGIRIIAPHRVAKKSTPTSTPQYTNANFGKLTATGVFGGKPFCRVHEYTYTIIKYKKICSFSLFLYKYRYIHTHIYRRLVYSCTRKPNPPQQCAQRSKLVSTPNYFLRVLVGVPSHSILCGTVCPKPSCVFFIHSPNHAVSGVLPKIHKIQHRYANNSAQGVANKYQIVHNTGTIAGDAAGM